MLTKKKAAARVLWAAMLTAVYALGVLPAHAQDADQPNLQVGMTIVSDAGPAPGRWPTLSTRVSNTGAAVSPATTLRVYRSTDTTITTSDTQVDTVPLGALSGSGSEMIAFAIGLTAPSTAGTYYYGVCVDTVTDESDTTDNCSASVTVVVGTGQLQSVAEDTDPPVVTVTSNATGPVSSEFDVTVTFSEPTTGFATSDLDITNGSAIRSLSTSDGAVHTVTIAPDEGVTGTITITVPAAVATDAANNDNVASEAFEIEVQAALTARFENVPSSHDGSRVFRLRLAFSEEVFDGSEAFDKNRAIWNALVVSGGAVRGARRVDRYEFDQWWIRVAPSNNGAVTVSLPAQTDCEAAGVVCTPDGTALSSPVLATVPGPASQTRTVSIAATNDTQTTRSVTADSSHVTEGTAAEFTLTRTGSLADALTVNVSVTESGAMLKGTPPATAIFNANSATAELSVETEDDEIDESASVITAELSAGNGYSTDADAASATVTAEDDDATPVVITVSPLDAMENDVAISTLQATDDDTAIANLSWSVMGGADQGEVALSADGVLAFRVAKDFEAPDDADRDGVYEVTVRVTDGANPVDAALTVRLADVGEIAPELSRARVDGDVLTLTFDAALDSSSAPTASAFSATVDGAARGVPEVSMSASTVTLTLASAVVSGETVTVGYTAQTGANAHPLRDVAGNPVAGFDDEAVTNDTRSEPLVSLDSFEDLWVEGSSLLIDLVRVGDVSAELTVNVSVTETGAMLDGTLPSSVTFSAGSQRVRLPDIVKDDLIDEPDSEITITILAGNGYRVSETNWDGASVTVTVNDNDWAPEIVTPSPVLVAENRTAIATLRAKTKYVLNADPNLQETLQKPLGERLTWSLVGGADADKVTLSTGGDLAFKTAKDFEAPDDADRDGGYEIEVRVTDGHNATDASLTIRLTNVSATATGKPAISDTVPQVGQVLTATKGTIDDDDGVPGTFTYQWVRVDGGGESDISGATSSTFRLSAADVGKLIKVKMSFTDGDGNDEGPLASDAYPSRGSVVAAKRACPTDADWCAEMTSGASLITDNPTLGAGNYAGDVGFTADGLGSLNDDTVSHGGVKYTVMRIFRSLLRLTSSSRDNLTFEVSGGALPDGTVVTVAGATLTVEADSDVPHEAGTEYWNITDLSLPEWARGQKVTVSLKFPANAPPTGLPTIAETARVGETLKASASDIADADGLTNATFAWQWVANDGNSDSDIAGATSETYTLTAAEEGKTVKVRVTFTDDGGTEETLVSAATATVAAVLPVVSIAAASSAVTEGAAASFTLSRTGDKTAAVTVPVSVTETGSVLSGTPANSVTFAAGSAEASLAVATEDDGVAEAAGRVTASVSAGTGYAADSGTASAGVDVYDNDQAVSASAETLWTSTLEWTDLGGGWLIANAEDFTSSSWSEDGASFNVWYFAYDTSSGDFWLRLSSDTPAGGIPELGELTLQVGEVTVEPGDAMTAFATGGIGIARNVRQDWAAGDRIEVRLTRTEAGETVASGPGISVADAQVHEAEGAVLSFRVTLDAAQTSTVSVRYATSDGTAVAGSDYVARSGALRFAPGETSKTVSVPVLNDTHDEGSETMMLTLSNPFGAQLADGTATGTIKNTDPIPKAWVARFGRTVADQVLDAVDARLRASRTAGMSVSLAGQRLGLAAPKSGAETAAVSGAAAESDPKPALLFGGTAAADAEETARLKALSDWLKQETAENDRTDSWSRTLNGREVLMGSSFSLAAQTEGGGFAGLWGRMAQTRFAGREGVLSLDGDVTTGLVGADYALGRWTTGLVVSHSIGEGGYRGERSGEIEASVTALTPWAGYAVTERLSVWGAAGYGAGELKLTPGDDPALKTDLGMTLAAAGARGTLIDGDGPKLDAVGDARWVRATTARVSSSSASDGGNLDSASAEVTRLRLGLEGSWPLALDEGTFGKGAAVTPRLALGVRHDGGDAETGFGADIGGGVALEAPAHGLRVSLEGRGVLTHEAADLRDRGVAGTLAWNPSAVGPGSAADAHPDDRRGGVGRHGRAAVARHAGGSCGQRQRRRAAAPGGALRLRLRDVRGPVHGHAGDRARPVRGGSATTAWAGG